MTTATRTADRVSTQRPVAAPDVRTRPGTTTSTADDRETREAREARVVQVVSGVVLAALLPVIVHAFAAAWGDGPPAVTPLGQHQLLDDRAVAPATDA